MELENAKVAITPGEDRQREVPDDDLLDGISASRYREMAARINYLAQDRPDTAFTAKEICRGMSAPTQLHCKILKRCGRYIKGSPRAIARYDFEERCDTIVLETDSDWVGEKSTGKSTSGGVICMGSHWIKSWSKTQHCVTLSTAEAELVAIVKGQQKSLR